MKHKYLKGLVLAALLGLATPAISGVSAAEATSGTLAPISLPYGIVQSSDAVKTKVSPDTIAIKPQLVSTVMTTVDNKTVNLPAGVTVFDLKRMMTPMGMVDGTKFISAKELNAEYVKDIRDMASKKELNIKELKDFNGTIYRDWNMYQLRGEDAEGVHTAYVVDLALGPDYIKGERANLEISNALWEAADKSVANTKKSAINSRDGVQERDSMKFAKTAAIAAAYMSQVSNTGDSKEQLGHTWQVVRDLGDELTKQQEAMLAPYPAEYDADAFYTAMLKGTEAVPVMRDAAAFNQFVDKHKNNLVKALVADLDKAIGELKKEAETNERAKEKLELNQSLRDGLKKFFATSDIKADYLSELEQLNSHFGPVLYSEARDVFTFDSYEIPLGGLNLVRFDKEGPVITVLTTNDGDFNYWQKQWQRMYNLEPQVRAFTADAKNTAIPAKKTTTHMKALGHDGNIVVPRDLTVKRLSDTVIIPALKNFMENETKKAVEKGPELRDWVTDKLLVGEEREASIEYYNRLKERLQFYEDYRLGEKSDVYQWQMKDSEGRKTATVFGMVLTPKTSQGLYSMLQKDFLDFQLPAINSYWMESNGALKQMILKATNLSSMSDYAFTSVTIKDQTPWALLPHYTHPAYTGSARAFINVNGFELPYYIQGAVVLTEPDPVVYIMFTSDLERDEFAPRFVQFIQEL
ncbi:MAG: hypothetical protein E7204_00400 [Veillonella sp.]|uniref:hypothetical protein n=1 Tax=Veillonella sp. TaxID=1926307 RepID=UPI0025FD2CEA|nr:hypothetical protein [Veillonella sp.]MBE6079307.1 hypothetical protein [Veillonella sp.]